MHNERHTVRVLACEDALHRWCHRNAMARSRRVSRKKSKRVKLHRDHADPIMFQVKDLIVPSSFTELDSYTCARDSLSLDFGSQSA